MNCLPCTHRRRMSGLGDGGTGGGSGSGGRSRRRSRKADRSRMRPPLPTALMMSGAITCPLAGRIRPRTERRTSKPSLLPRQAWRNRLAEAAHGRVGLSTFGRKITSASSLRSRATMASARKTLPASSMIVVVVVGLTWLVAAVGLVTCASPAKPDGLKVMVTPATDLGRVNGSGRESNEDAVALLNASRSTSAGAELRSVSTLVFNATAKADLLSGIPTWKHPLVLLEERVSRKLDATPSAAYDTVSVLANSRSHGKSSASDKGTDGSYISDGSGRNIGSNKERNGSGGQMTLRFDRKLYEATLSEGVPVGSFVATVHAACYRELVDAETDVDGEPRYSIDTVTSITFAALDAGSNSTEASTTRVYESWFNIDYRSGLVTTAQLLDREAAPAGLDVRIAAVCCGNTEDRRTAYSVLRVRLLDENDHTPTFVVTNVAAPTAKVVTGHIAGAAFAEAETDRRCRLESAEEDWSDAELQKTCENTQYTALRSGLAGCGFHRTVEKNATSAKRTAAEKGNEEKIVANSNVQTTAPVRHATTAGRRQRPTEADEFNGKDNDEEAFYDASDIDSGFGATGHRSERVAWRRKRAEVIAQHRRHWCGDQVRQQTSPSYNDQRRPPQLIARVGENKPPNTLVTVVNARDEDSGTSGAVRYSLHPASELLHGDAFTVNAIDGRLSTRVPLDRERLYFTENDSDAAAFRLTLVAHDGGRPAARFATLDVAVVVDDVNDNAPVFYPTCYFFEAYEGATFGEFVGRVRATDADCGCLKGVNNSSRKHDRGSGGNGSEVRADEEGLCANPNGRVRYSLLTATSDGHRNENASDNDTRIPFVVDADTGRISVGNATLRRHGGHARSWYRLMVAARNPVKLMALTPDDETRAAGGPLNGAQPTWPSSHGRGNSSLLQQEQQQVARSRAASNVTSEGYHSSSYATVKHDALPNQSVAMVFISVIARPTNSTLITESGDAESDSELTRVPQWDLQHGLAESANSGSSSCYHRFSMVEDWGNAGDVGVGRAAGNTRNAKRQPFSSQSREVGQIDLRNMAATVSVAYADNVSYHIVDGDPHGWFVVKAVERGRSQHHGVARALLVLTSGLAPVDREVMATLNLTVLVVGSPGGLADGDLSATARRLQSAGGAAEGASGWFARMSGEIRVLEVCSIHIDVRDVNDNRPRFERPVVELDVPESTPIGFEFWRARATDADSGDGAELAFSIVAQYALPPDAQLYETTTISKLFDAAQAASESSSRSGRNLVTIDSCTGSLIFVESLSGYAGRQILVEILATDGCTDQQQLQLNVTATRSTSIDCTPTTAPTSPAAAAADDGEDGRHDDERALWRGDRQWLVLRVTDVNDHSPTFDRHTYEAFVSELAALNERFLAVRAVDADPSDAGRVGYSLAVPHAVATNGTIGNDGNADDDDRGDSNDRLPFGIFPDGWLFVRRPLDHERCDRYEFVVTARDGVTADARFPIGDVRGGVRTSSATVIVHVLDENDNKPRFVHVGATNADVTRARGRSGSSNHGRFNVTVSSATSNGSINCGVEDNDTRRENCKSDWKTQSHDQHHPVTGNSVASIDRASQQFLPAPVNASTISNAIPGNATLRLSGITTFEGPDDSKQPQQRQQRGQRKHGHRPEQQPSESWSRPLTDEEAPVRVLRFRVRENFPANTFVGTLAAADADSGLNAALTFALASRHEARATQAVTTASDADQRGDSSFIRSRASRRSEARPDDRRAKRGSSVAEYSVSEVAGDSGGDYEHDFPFTLDAMTGVLRTLRPLDRETRSRYSAEVVVRDRGTPSLSSTARLVVIVSDENDNAPRFDREIYAATLSEASSPGAAVTRVHASDADFGPNGRVRYALVGAHDATPFVIDESSGNVTLAAGHTVDSNHSDTVPLSATTLSSSLLDRERLAAADSVIEVVVKAVDSAADGCRRSATALLRITILDENDCAPEFVASVAKASNAESALPSGSATGSGPSLTMTSEPLELADGIVVLPWGVDATRLVSLPPPLTTTTTTQRTSGQNQTDRWPPAVVTANVTSDAVSWSANNDHSFHHDSWADLVAGFGSATGIVVPENTPVHGVLYRFAAIDADLGLNGYVTYTFTARVAVAATSEGVREADSQIDADAQDTFRLDPRSGVLTLARPLDFESPRRKFLLAVKASDSGSPPLTTVAAAFEVRVADINDNAPVFPKGRIVRVLREDAAFGTLVAVVAATDRDSGFNGRVRHSLVRVAPTATLAAAPALAPVGAGAPNSRTAVPIFEARYLLSDWVSHRPAQDAASRASRQGALPKTATSASPSTKVENVEALSSYGRPLFRIDAETGAIYTTTRPLDRELVDSYELTVKASDSGHPFNFAYKVVTVEIEDVNDNTPRFVSPLAAVLPNCVSAAVSGGSSGNEWATVTVGQALAIDADDGENGRVRYKLVAASRAESSGRRGRGRSRGHNRGRRQENQDPSARSDKNRHSATVSPPARVSVAPAAFNVDSGTGRIEMVVARSSCVLANQRASCCNAESLRTDYDLRVRAYDSADGIHQRSAEAIIRLIAASNDGSSANRGARGAAGVRFERHRYEASVSENVPVGTEVLTVRVAGASAAAVVGADDDVGDLEYYIVQATTTNGNGGGHADGSNPFSGASRGGGFASRTNTSASSTSSSTVTSSINTNSTSSSGNVSRDAALGRRFVMDRLSGVIRTGEPLDRELAPGPYRLLVVAVVTRGASRQIAEATVVVTISDVNDNAPRLVDLPQAFVVSERDASVVGVTLFEGQVFDPDDGHQQAKISDAFRLELVADPADSLVLAGRRRRTAAFASPADHDRSATAAIAAISGGREGGARGDGDESPLFDGLSVTLNSAAAGVAWDDDCAGGLSTDVAGVRRRFRLDARRVALVLAEPLDRERCAAFRFGVRVSDGTLTSVASVAVVVGDENDNPVEFSTSPVWFDVSEDAPRGTRLGRLPVSDADEGVNGQPVFSFLPHWWSRLFSLDPFSGEVTLIGSLDYEQDRHYVFMAVARDSGWPIRHSATASIFINVVDINDNVPTCRSDEKQVKVAEDLPVGSLFAQISISDLDDGPNGEVKLSILEGDDQNKFLVTSGGNLLTRASLDRETVDSYNLVIQAKDSGQPPLSSTCRVKISVLDVNDNTPVCVTPNVTVTIAEDAPVNTVVTVVRAVDPDEGDNGIVDYSLVTFDGSPISVDSDDVLVDQLPADTGTAGSVSATSADMASARLFTLGTIDGVLRVAPAPKASAAFGGGSSVGKGGYRGGGLDYQTARVHVLHVMARDRGYPSRATVCRVAVHVLDANYHSPRFERRRWSLAVREDAPVGVALAKLHATDADPTDRPAGRVRYALAAGDPAKRFSIDEDSGVLRVGGPLDRERVSHYLITVRAEDSAAGTRYDTATVSITVVNVNDCASTFPDSPYEATILENFEPANDREGILVARLVAVDADEHDANPRAPGSRVPSPAASGAGGLHYKLAEGDESLFRVNASTGDVHVMRALDREREPFAVATVVAVDSGPSPLTGTALLVLYVLDVNDNAPVFSLGSEVTEALRADARSPKSSSAIQDTLSADMTPMNSTRRVLKLYVRENRPAGELVHVIRATDLDEGFNARLRYSLADPSDAFSLDPRSGQLRTRRPIDREAELPLDESRTAGFISDDGGGDGSVSTALFTMRVVCADRNGMAGSRRAVLDVIVYVEDENDNAPRFSSDVFDVDVPDDAATGHFIFGERARDADLGRNQRVTYTLTGPRATLFRVDTRSGVVMLAANLSELPIELGLVATDNGLTPRSSNVTLRIRGRTRAEFPRFVAGKRDFEVSEGAPRGFVVTELQAQAHSSASPASPIVYRLAGGHTADAFFVGERSGLVSLAYPLDFETSAHHQLWIGATELSTNLTCFVKLSIAVLDINDNAPACTQTESNVTLLEDLQPSVVMQLNVTDPDSGNNGQFYFTLESISSPTSVVQHSHAESAMSLPSKLSVGGKFANAGVITEMLAAASRSDINFFSAIAASNNSSKTISKPPFLVDPESGKIFATQRFDRESVDRYDLVVLAVDRGSPALTGTCFVTIMIGDRNDNSPRFTRLFSANVTENAAIGTFVVRITSSDKDVGVNARPIYSLEAGVSAGVESRHHSRHHDESNEDDYDDEHDGNSVLGSFYKSRNNSCLGDVNGKGAFSIDTFTGDVRVSGPIDREQCNEYLLRVSVFDGAWKQVTSVTVSVLDVNDNPPMFRRAFYEFVVMDPFDDNGYAPQSQQQQQDEYRRPRRRPYRRQYRGSDVSVPISPRRGWQNDLKPGDLFRTRRTNSSDKRRFKKLLLSSSTYKPSQVRRDAFVVGRVRARDPDTSTARVTYQLRKASNIFSIDPMTGHIFVRKPLILRRKTPRFDAVSGDNGNSECVGGDAYCSCSEHELCRESAKSTIEDVHILRVMAIDDGHPALSSEATVTIRIFHESLLSKNWRRPFLSFSHFFDRQEYVVPVPFTTPVGSRLMRFGKTIRDKTSNHNGLDIKTEVDKFNNVAGVRGGVFVCRYDKSDSGNVKLVRIPPYWQLEYSLLLAPQLLGSIRNQSSDIDMTDSAHQNASSLEFPTELQETCESLRSLVQLDQAGWLVLNRPLNGCLGLQFSGWVRARYLKGGIDSETSNDTFIPSDSEFVDFARNVTGGVARDVSKITLWLQESLHASGFFHAAKQKKSVEVTSSSHRLSDNVARIIIQVTEENRHAPVFHVESHAAYTVLVAEDIAVGTVILRLNATDEDNDLNGVLSYQLQRTSQSPSKLTTGQFQNVQFKKNDTDIIENPFTIDQQTGAIRLTTSLDYESCSEYSFHAVATDSALVARSSSVKVTINVKDVNDCAPSFNKSEFHVYIHENQPPGTFVARLAAKDADLSPEYRVIRYSLGALEALNCTGDCFAGNKTIDKDERLVNNCTSAPPAAHSDNSYSTTNLGELFSLDSETGVVETKSALDFEIRHEYAFQIIAFNPSEGQGGGLLTACRLVVHVIDVNEFVPCFSRKTYELYASDEIRPTKEAIGFVSAVDYDGGPDNQVNYVLACGADCDTSIFGSGYLKPPVRVDPFSGAVTLIPPTPKSTGGYSRSAWIDFVAFRDRKHQVENFTYYSQETIKHKMHFIVIAKNSGPLRRSSDVGEARLTVAVLGKNNPPVFKQTRYKAHIIENAPAGEFVVQVSAVDNDPNLNASRVTYTLNERGARGAFVIDPNDGVVRTADAPHSPLDREAVPFYEFTVAAIDSGMPPMTSTAVVQVHVDDVNDNAPQIATEDTVALVYENQPPGTVVMRLVPYDADLPAHGAPFSYTILEGDDEKESIDSSYLNADGHADEERTGGGVWGRMCANCFTLDVEPTTTAALVRTSRTFDRERDGDRLSFVIEIADSGRPTNVSRTQITVLVGDQNDNAPSARNHTIVAVVPLSVHGDIDSVKAHAARDDEADILGRDRDRRKRRRYVLVGNVAPLDPDSGDSFYCLLLRAWSASVGTKDEYDASVVYHENTVSGMKFKDVVAALIVAKNCSLYAELSTRKLLSSLSNVSSYAGEERFILLVQANDYKHDNVTSEINIRFLFFDDQSAALEHSITLRSRRLITPIKSVTASYTFMNDLDNQLCTYVLNDLVGFNAEKFSVGGIPVLLGVAYERHYFKSKDFKLTANNYNWTNEKTINKVYNDAFTIAYETDSKFAIKSGSEAGFLQITFAVMKVQTRSSLSHSLKAVEYVSTEKVLAALSSNAQLLSVFTLGYQPCDGNNGDNGELYHRADIAVNRTIKEPTWQTSTCYNGAQCVTELQDSRFGVHPQQWQQQQQPWLHIFNSPLLIVTAPVVILEARCVCPPFYSGTRCEHHLPPPQCALNLCTAGSSCVPIVTTVGDGEDRGVIAGRSSVGSPGYDPIEIKTNTSYGGTSANARQELNDSAIASISGAGNGFYRCLCPPAQYGRYCEHWRNFSDNAPCLLESSRSCLNGGTCAAFDAIPLHSLHGDRVIPLAPATFGLLSFNVSETPRHRCMCPPNFHGSHCEKRSFGFGPYSSMTFDIFRNIELAVDLSIVFSTYQKNGLLLYTFDQLTTTREHVDTDRHFDQYGEVSRSNRDQDDNNVNDAKDRSRNIFELRTRSDFLALELIDGRARFSFSVFGHKVTRLVAGDNLADGRWHRLKALRTGHKATLEVDDCIYATADRCEKCESKSGNAGCSAVFLGDFWADQTHFSFYGNPLYIGGLATVSSIIERSDQLDSSNFIGCIHSVTANGRELDLAAPLRAVHVFDWCPRLLTRCDVLLFPGMPTAASTLTHSAAHKTFLSSAVHEPKLGAVMRSGWQCPVSGGCTLNWQAAACRCALSGNAGPLCSMPATESLHEAFFLPSAKILTTAAARTAASLSFVELVPTEAFRRTFFEEQQIDRSNQRVLPDSTRVNVKLLKFAFRTYEPDGLLFLSKSRKGFTVLSLVNGTLLYQSCIKGYSVAQARIKNPVVADGAWHFVTLAFYKRSVLSTSRILLTLDDAVVEIDAANVRGALPLSTIAFPEVVPSVNTFKKLFAELAGNGEPLEPAYNTNDESNRYIRESYKLHDFLDPFVTSLAFGGSDYRSSSFILSLAASQEVNPLASQQKRHVKDTPNLSNVTQPRQQEQQQQLKRLSSRQRDLRNIGPADQGASRSKNASDKRTAELDHNSSSKTLDLTTILSNYFTYPQFRGCFRQISVHGELQTFNPATGSPDPSFSRTGPTALFTVRLRGYAMPGCSEDRFFSFDTNIKKTSHDRPQGAGASGKDDNDSMTKGTSSSRNPLKIGVIAVVIFFSFVLGVLIISYVRAKNCCQPAKPHQTLDSNTRDLSPRGDASDHCGLEIRFLNGSKIIQNTSNNTCVAGTEGQSPTVLLPASTAMTNQHITGPPVLTKANSCAAVTEKQEVEPQVESANRDESVRRRSETNAHSRQANSVLADSCCLKSHRTMSGLQGTCHPADGLRKKQDLVGSVGLIVNAARCVRAPTDQNLARSTASTVPSVRVPLSSDGNSKPSSALNEKANDAESCLTHPLNVTLKESQPTGRQGRFCDLVVHPNTDADNDHNSECAEKGKAYLPPALPEESYRAPSIIELASAAAKTNSDHDCQQQAELLLYAGQPTNLALVASAASLSSSCAADVIGEHDDVKRRNGSSAGLQTSENVECYDFENASSIAPSDIDIAYHYKAFRNSIGAARGLEQDDANSISTSVVANLEKIAVPAENMVDRKAENSFNLSHCVMQPCSHGSQPLSLLTSNFWCKEQNRLSPEVVSQTSSSVTAAAAMTERTAAGSTAMPGCREADCSALSQRLSPSSAEIAWFSQNQLQQLLLQKQKQEQQQLEMINQPKPRDRETNLPAPLGTTPLARLSPSSEMSSAQQRPRRILTLHDLSSGRPLERALLAAVSGTISPMIGTAPVDDDDDECDPSVPLAAANGTATTLTTPSNCSSSGIIRSEGFQRSLSPTALSRSPIDLTPTAFDSRCSGVSSALAGVAHSPSSLPLGDRQPLTLATNSRRQVTRTHEIELDLTPDEIQRLNIRRHVINTDASRTAVQSDQQQRKRTDCILGPVSASDRERSLVSPSQQGHDMAHCSTAALEDAGLHYLYDRDVFSKKNKVCAGTITANKHVDFNTDDMTDTREIFRGEDGDDELTSVGGRDNGDDDSGPNNSFVCSDFEYNSGADLRINEFESAGDMRCSVNDGVNAFEESACRVVQHKYEAIGHNSKK